MALLSNFSKIVPMVEILKMQYQTVEIQEQVE